MACRSSSPLVKAILNWRTYRERNQYPATGDKNTSNINAVLLMKLPQEIEYSGAPDQLQSAVVFGDPTKPGLYVQRFRFPPGLKVPPHWHPEEMRTVVVLSGTLYYAFGENWD